MPNLQNSLKDILGQVYGPVIGSNLPPPEPSQIDYVTPILKEETAPPPIEDQVIPEQEVVSKEPEVVKEEPVQKADQELQTSIDNTNKQIKNLSLKTLEAEEKVNKILDEEELMKLTQPGRIEQETQRFSKERVERINKLFPPIQRQTLIAKGDNFKSFMNVALGVLTGGGYWAGFNEFADQEYARAVSERNQDIALYQQGEDQYMAKLNYRIDLAKTAVSMVDTKLKYSQNQTEIAQLSQGQSLLLKQLQDDEAEKKAIADKEARDEAFQREQFEEQKIMNRKKLALQERNTKANELSASIQNLKNLSEMQKKQTADPLRQLPAIDIGGKKHPVEIGYTKEAQIEKASGAVSEAKQRFTQAKGVLDLHEKLTKVSYPKLKVAKLTGPFTEKLGIDNKTYGALKELSNKIHDFFGSSKEKLGLGRLSDEDVKIINNLIKRDSDGSIQLDALTPEGAKAFKNYIIADAIYNQAKSYSKAGAVVTIGNQKRKLTEKEWELYIAQQNGFTVDDKGKFIPMGQKRKPVSLGKSDFKVYGAK